MTVAFDRFEVKRGGPGLSRPDVTATRPGNGASTSAATRSSPPTSSCPTPAPASTRTRSRRATSSCIARATGSSSTRRSTRRRRATRSCSSRCRRWRPTRSTRSPSPSGLQDTSGHAFLPYTATFTTGSSTGGGDPSISFEKVGLSTAMGQSFASVDDRPGQPAVRDDAHRATSSATTSTPTARSASRWSSTPSARATAGRASSPGSISTPLPTRPTRPSGSRTARRVYENATDFTGKISRLAGANLQFYTDMVVGLPRSIRDHLTNQLKFGPGGKLYFTQGSNSALARRTTRGASAKSTC